LLLASKPIKVPTEPIDANIEKANARTVLSPASYLIYNVMKPPVSETTKKPTIRAPIGIIFHI